MKLTLLVLGCLIGMVVSEHCISSPDCQLTTCSTDFILHCLDNQCICQSPTTGVACQEDHDCRDLAHGQEKCYADRQWEWKCFHGFCHCRD